MTEATLEQRISALKPPMTHDQMAAATAHRGWWFMCEHWLRNMRAYIGSVFGVGLLHPILFLLAMGVGLGMVVDGATDTESVLGMSYLTFIGPALLLSTALSTAMEENTFTVMAGFKWRRTYYGPQVTPITPTQIASGHVAGTIIRYSLTITIFLTVLFVFGAVEGARALWLIPLGVLTSAAVGLAIMAYSSHITEDRGQFALINRFVIMPMTLFSGTFFPLESMPIFVQPLGWVSPLWHAVSLGRALVTPATIPVWLGVLHVAYLLALCLGGWLIARRQYNRRLVG